MRETVLKTELGREAMRALAPDLVATDEAEGPEVVPRYVLAWAVAPGGETVPGPGEADADAVRAWAERALTFQCRSHGRGRGTRMMRPRAPLQVPDAVVDHILNLARDETLARPVADVPLMGRVAARLARREPDPGPPAPAPAPRP